MAAAVAKAFEDINAALAVPEFSLLGLTGEPAMLDGYGPIPASMARDLVAGGASSFHRVRVDPRDAAPLHNRTPGLGTTPMAPPISVRNRWVRVRDR